MMMTTQSHSEDMDMTTQLRDLLREQAEDDGLWFVAKTAPEAYLQQDLRRLHHVAEAALASRATSGEAVAIREYEILEPENVGKRFTISPEEFAKIDKARIGAGKTVLELIEKIAEAEFINLASQQQARAPQAGWVQLLHETRALLAEWGEWYYCRKDDAPSHKMERVLAAIDAAIAAEPNAQE
jgi:hypothetical protein